MAKTKFYDIFLPVGEKGDDFNFHLEQSNGNTTKALDGMAEYYETAAETCKQLAKLVNQHPEVEICGDKDIMHINWPEDNKDIANKIYKLINDGYVEVVEFEEEPDQFSLN